MLFNLQGKLKKYENGEHKEELNILDEKMNILQGEVQTWQARAETSAAEVDKLNHECEL